MAGGQPRAIIYLIYYAQNGYGVLRKLDAIAAEREAEGDKLMEDDIGFADFHEEMIETEPLGRTISPGDHASGLTCQPICVRLKLWECFVKNMSIL